MQEARVAVIMRTQNRSLLLARAIDSVLAQTYPNWLLVLVNDGGPSAAHEDVLATRRQALGERLILIHNERPVGRKAAMNLGVRACHTEFIAMLDDDDTWAPSFLAETVGFLETAAPHWGGVVTHTVNITERLHEGGVTESAREPSNPDLGGVYLSRLLQRNQYATSAFVYRRRVYEQIGGYREDYEMVGDWEFNIRFALAAEIFVIAKELEFAHSRVGSQDEKYENSTSRHANHEARLANEWLRRDLSEGRMGVGLAMLVMQEIAAPLQDMRFRLRRFDFLHLMRKQAPGLAQTVKEAEQRLRKLIGR